MDVTWPEDTISATTENTCGDYNIMIEFNSVLSTIDTGGPIDPALTTCTQVAGSNQLKFVSS